MSEKTTSSFDAFPQPLVSSPPSLSPPPPTIIPLTDESEEGEIKNITSPKKVLQECIDSTFDGINGIFQKKILRIEISSQTNYLQSLHKELGVCDIKRTEWTKSLAIHEKILLEHNARYNKLKEEMDVCLSLARQEEDKIDTLYDLDNSLSRKQHDINEMIKEVELSIRKKIILISKHHLLTRNPPLDVKVIREYIYSLKERNPILSFPTNSGIIKEHLQEIIKVINEIPFIKNIIHKEDRGVDEVVDEVDKVNEGGDMLVIDPNIILCIDALNGECLLNLNGDCPYQHISPSPSLTNITPAIAISPRDDIIQVLRVIFDNVNLNPPHHTIIPSHQIVDSPINEYFSFIKDLNEDSLISSLGIGDIVGCKYIIIDSEEISIDKSVPFAFMIPLIIVGISSKIQDKEQFYQLLERSLISLKGNSALLVMLIYYRILRDVKIIERIAKMFLNNSFNNFDLLEHILDEEECLIMYKLLGGSCHSLLVKIYHSLSPDQLLTILSNYPIRDEKIIWYMLMDSIEGLNGFPPPSILIPLIRKIPLISDALLEYIDSIS